MTVSETPISKAVDFRADFDPQIELVRRARQGNEVALQDLIEENINLIRDTSCLHQTNGWYTQDDAVQEGRKVVANSVARFDESNGAKFSTYLYGGLRNEARNHNRKLGAQKRTSPLREPVSLDKDRGEGGEISLHDMIPDPIALSPEEYVEKKLLTVALEKAMESLSDKRMPAVLGLFSLPGMTNEAIGEVSGFSRETARTLKNRALEEMKNSPAGKNLKYGSSSVRRRLFTRNFALCQQPKKIPSLSN